MLGISIFAVIMTYVTFGIFHALDKMGKHISSYSDKSMEDAPKLTIEDMYSPTINCLHSSKWAIHILFWCQITLSIRRNLCLPTILSI